MDLNYTYKCRVRQVDATSDRVIEDLDLVTSLPDGSPNMIHRSRTVKLNDHLHQSDPVEHILNSFRRELFPNQDCQDKSSDHPAVPVPLNYQRVVLLKIRELANSILSNGNFDDISRQKIRICVSFVMRRRIEASISGGFVSAALEDAMSTCFSKELNLEVAGEE